MRHDKDLEPHRPVGAEWVPAPDNRQAFDKDAEQALPGFERHLSAQYKGGAKARAPCQRPGCSNARAVGKNGHVYEYCSAECHDKDRERQMQAHVSDRPAGREPHRPVGAEWVPAPDNRQAFDKDAEQALPGFERHLSAQYKGGAKAHNPCQRPGCSNARAVGKNGHVYEYCSAECHDKDHERQAQVQTRNRPVDQETHSPNGEARVDPSDTRAAFDKNAEQLKPSYERQTSHQYLGGSKRRNACQRFGCNNPREVALNGHVFRYCSAECHDAVQRELTKVQEYKPNTMDYGVADKSRGMLFFSFLPPPLDLYKRTKRAIRVCKLP